MSPRLTNTFRRTRRWLLPAALLALTPKCFLCFVGYAGLGTALGLGGPEFCGASSDMTYTRALSIVLSSLGLGVIGLYVRHRRSHHNTPET